MTTVAALNDKRAISAMQLVVDGLGDERTASGQRLVKSQSREGAFYVTTETSCSCPDATYRQRVCKHSLALRLQRTIDDALAGEQVDRMLKSVSNYGVIPASQIERED